jgi:peptidoglycan lytic transglycosylase G
MIKQYLFKGIVMIATLFFLLACAMGIFLFWLHRDFNTPLNLSDRNQRIEIEQGMTLRQTADMLQQNQVIKNSTTFIIAGKWKKLSGRIQSGEYHLSGSMTPHQIMAKLVSGEVVYHQFTVPEGFTARQTAGKWQQDGFGNAEDFLHSLRNLDRNGFPSSSDDWEGYLFPETYTFPKGATSHEIISMMIDQLLTRLRPEWLTSAEQLGLNLHQVITLASLIERESSRVNERTLISAVFHNRLKRGMLLQCDPTVIYALGDQYKGVLKRVDLKIDHPYNTYLYPGLPPGPISNAGEASLHAACYPAHVDYLYFVADNKGGHVFSKTLVEHNRAVQSYRNNRKKFRHLSRRQ